MTSSGTPAPRSKLATYEIVVRGELSEHFTSTFLNERVGSTSCRARVESGDGTTAIEIEVIDQAHLIAILERLRDAAVEIERVNPAHETKGTPR
jgi:hypothetical protein